MKTFEEVTNYLYQKLPFFQKQGHSSLNYGLEKIQLFCNYLKNPQKNYPSIHIAGTNGKGSCSHWVASVLSYSGYRVGLYTSPHLKCYTERIQVDGVKIDRNYILSFVTSHQSFIESHQLSFFEFTVGLAFDYFSHKKVEAAVIEVGLGGRLDSTNIISPLISLITNISYDHTAVLGTTIEEIAWEKAGIIKYATPVVVGEKQKETTPVFLNMAKQKNTQVHFSQEYFSIRESQPHIILKDIKNKKSYKLLWNHPSFQKKNIISSLTILSLLQPNFPKYHIKHTFSFIESKKCFTLQGRWQELQKSPKLICDVGHNLSGIEYIREALEKEKFETLHLILGFSKDKDVVSILKLFPQKAQYYFCHPKDNTRSYSSDRLFSYAKQMSLSCQAFSSVSEAIQVAMQKASKRDVLFIGGSHFIVAEIPFL